MPLQRTLNLLLLEDNPHDVKHFTAIVGRQDTTIVVASNGGEALDRIFRRGKFQREPSFDLVVLDLNVPLLNGHEVLSVIKGNSETRHIPAIVWTVSEDPRDIRRAFDLGCCAYMIKPTDLGDTENLLRAFAEFWLCRTRYPVMLNREDVLRRPRDAVRLSA